MPQVPVAVVTDNLGAAAIWIRMVIDCPWDLVVETGPATVTVELVGGLVKRSIAASTDVCSWLFRVGVLTAKGSFRSLVLDHMFFLGRQFIVIVVIHAHPPLLPAH